MSDINDTILGENTSRHGKTRYHYITNDPNTMFNGPEQKPQNIDFSFLSPEKIGEDMQEKQRAKAAYKDHYLIDLNDKQLEMMNTLVAQSENPEEEMFKLATIVKYADAFNLPMQFVSNNLESINKEWIGTGATPYKNNFQAVADSFLIGVNTLNLSMLGNRLMIAEKAGNEKEVQSLLKQLQEAENKNLSLQDRIPRSWVTNILKAGANTIPFSSTVLLPSLAASVASPLASGVVGFGISTTMQNGLEYWELRKAGVKRELAEHLANTSAFIQAGIETSLGNVAGVMAKGLKIDTVTSKVLKKLTAQRVLPTLARVIMQYGGEMVEEGVEEALQELVSAGTKATAAALQGEGVETEDAWTIAGNVWESFKGGMAGSIVLGIPGAVINGKTQFSEAKNIKKESIINPSKEAFIKQAENLSVFEGLNGADKNEYLSEYYDSQQYEREQFQNSKAKSYEEWLAPDARIEGETVRDSAGRVVYETDAEGKPVYQETDEGLQKKEKKYGKAPDVVRAGERLYLSEGYRHERKGGRIDGEYIVGNPTEQTEYNDYGHIYYSFDKQKNTVTIKKVEMQSDAYESIIKEFVRDFGEKFQGAEIVWEPKGEALQKIKAELIAENPRGEKGGLQYFTDGTEEAETRAAIKLNERLKETMPNLDNIERNVLIKVFNALAQGKGVDTEEYLKTHYADEIFTNTPPVDMSRIAAQEGINTKEIKGAIEFKELSGYVKRLIYVSEKADFSTVVHEVAHGARVSLEGELLQKAERAFGVEDGKWTRSQDEAFARGFEQYLREGKAANAELQSVFQKAAEFLTRIYKSLKELVHLNDDIRAVYDELLTGEKSVLREAEQNAQQTEQRNRSSIKEFGQNYTDYYHKGIEALEKVLQEKKGQVVGAFTRADIGDIDVVWGNEKIGLQKIIAKHLNDFEPFGAGEQGVIYGIGEIVDKGTLKENNGVNTITYEKDGRSFRVGLTKGWNGKGENQWIITAYEENTGSGKGKTLSAVTEFNPSQTPEGTAAVTDTVQEKADTVKASETKKQVVDEAYRQATEAARQKVQESIEASKAKAADLAQNAAQYEKEAIESYKEQNPALSEADIKEKMQKEAARVRMSYEAFTQMQAQEARNLKEFGDVLFQTEPSEDETRQIEAIRKQYEGTDKWLKAPNGEDTNLTEQQWLQVRTDSFKKWFGDWENDPEEASKVVDKNGEPLAVSHSTHNVFDEFIYKQKIDAGWLGAGFYFFGDRSLDGQYGSHVMECFLNIREPYLATYEEKAELSEINSDEASQEFTETVKSEWDADGVYYNADLNQEWVAFYPNQIKSAVDNNGAFDAGNNNIYFQVEQDFFDEVAKSADAKAAQETIEEVITVGDPDAQTWKLFYSSAEERAKADKTFRDAIGPELEAALQKDIKNEKIKDETFLKMASEKEALRTFLREYNDAAQAGAIPAELTANLDGVFPSVAYAISNGKPFTEKQQRLAMDAIIQNTATYRNIFAEINGYTALRSLTDAEKAFTESFSKAATEGRVSRAEKANTESRIQTEAQSRADIDDARFLEEMADDEKLNAFLKEAAELSVFDFEQNTPADEAERAHFEDIKRKQERIYREMRNFSWKGTLAKVLHGEAPSEKSIANIRGQMRNAAHSFRSLYADIMERPDLRVQDADTTDARITTRLKSRPYKTVTLENLKLEQMSNAQKEALIRALDNEDIEQRVRQGAITSEDVEYIQGLVRSKNQTIKGLEAELADAKAENHNDTKRIGELEKKIKDERIARAVLADTIRARDVALKAVMKRISLKTCDAEQAQGLVAVQWFLKDKVQKALHANVDSEEQRIREAYTLWKTNGEYRQTLARMSTRRKEGDFKQLINNLDKKDFKDWTADDKKLARRLIPARNKFFSLGLYAKTEQNFSDMHTADLTPEAIDAAVSKILPESLVAKLKHQPLKQWTVDELIGLAQVIEEKHREGRQKYTAKIAAKQAEAARIRDASIKTLRGAKGYSDDNAGWSEDEKKEKGGFDALKRKLKYAAMRPYAFIEMLDGGKRGALYDMLEFEQRECYSRFKAGRDTRVEAFNSFLEKQGLTLADFEKKKTFENFYAEREQKSLTLTVQEILGAYLASFDDKSRAAVQYGNFAEQAERDMAKTSDSYGALDAFTDARYSAVLAEAERLMAADARLKATVEYLQAEYKKEGVRLREHNITVNNAVTEIRDNYFPMQRLEVSGEEDARQTQKKIIGEYSTGTRHGIGKGQTKARIDIGKANQMPINLAALTTYFSSVEANERLYAYDAYAQKLNRVIKGYEAKNFRRTLENAYGSEAVRYLDKQVNTIIDPTAGRVYSDSDKLLRVIRGNTAAAYLGFKLSGIIKQGITSPAPFMQYVNPLHYAKAASDLAFHHKEMVDFIYSRSKLMQDRSFDMMQNITEELAKQAKTKAGKVLTRTQQIGMQGLEMIDRACVAPGWLAAYREEAARLTEANKKAKTPKTDNEIDLAASRYADDVLVRTQPSGRAEELAPLFREGGEALRLLLQFQSSLNVIYNNLRHDLPNAIKNKQYKRAAGIVTGYALAGIMTGLITEGFGGDGDDEPDTADKVKKTIYFAFTQGTDSVPVINGMVNSLAEKLITGKTSYRGSSSLYPAFEKAVQGTAALRDADIQKAAGRYAEAAALTLGLPTSGTKEAIYAAEQVFNGQMPSALWGRR